MQAGAGIVADSVPQSEWEETQNKAKAVIRAAEVVQAGLDNQVQLQGAPPTPLNAEALSQLREEK